MCDLTVVNPTKDSFRIGVNTNQPFVIGLYFGTDPNFGNGTIQTYTANTFIANGNYNGFGQSGSFTVSLEQNGSDWNVNINITGSEHLDSRQFPATCSQSGNQLTFQSTNSSDFVTVTQDNGTWITDGKVLIKPSWVPVTVFLDANT